MNNIRNFSIIAHIDHGKSTLADRLLELTGAVEKRKMQAQVLDTMDLEREHGITIKLQPARMSWKNHELNLIDTPGHVDFGYEVSRSLAAVEGALLVVDATQGVQAQTLANLHQAIDHNLTIIPVINKIDLPAANIEDTIAELESLKLDFACEPLLISAKTGEGVEKVLDAVVDLIPSPEGDAEAPTRALIFDSYYDSYRGVVAYVRVVDGQIDKGNAIKMIQTGKETEALEVGSVCLGLHPSEKISTGDIGYIVTTLKDVSGARVGDTISISQNSNIDPLPGYREPQQVVFAGLYTTNGADFGKLREALGKLKLNDASLSYEPQNSKAFGFGFKAGFLGLLHLEIVKERLEREYDLDLIVTTPTVEYQQKSQNLNVKPQKDGKDLSDSDQRLTSNDYTSTQYFEPWITLEIISPQNYLGAVMQLVSSKRGVVNNVEYMADRVLARGEMPLSDAIVDFYDKLKAVTSGYGSLSYEISGYRPADLVALDIMVADELVEPLSRFVPREQVQGVARQVVERLKDLIPRQNFEVKIQAAVGGKILAAERLSPFRKDVTAKLYGGDVTRKRKLLEKQKKGKKKLARLGNVEVPTDVFVKLLRQ